LGTISEAVKRLGECLREERLGDARSAYVDLVRGLAERYRIEAAGLRQLADGLAKGEVRVQ
jgi:hypothetical protein